MKYIQKKAVSALASMISVFRSEIIPFALELILNLSRAFNRMAEEDMNDIYERYHKPHSLEILNIFRNLVNDFKERPEDLVKISFYLSPVFDYCIGKKNCYLLRLCS